MATPVTAEARLLGNVVGFVEHLGRHVALEHDALDGAGAVSDLQEVELAGRPAVVEPAVEGDLLALVAGDVCDVDGGFHSGLGG